MAYASVDDINANLPSELGVVIAADDVNVAKIQISVGRVIRGYLSPVVHVATMAAWIEPENTPEIIREIAAMLCASQLYFNQSAGTSLEIDVRNFAQLLYDKAIAMLEGILAGTIIVPGGIIDPSATAAMTDADFWPVDATNRAFSMGMLL